MDVYTSAIVTVAQFPYFFNCNIQIWVILWFEDTHEHLNPNKKINILHQTTVFTTLRFIFIFMLDLEKNILKRQ